MTDFIAEMIQAQRKLLDAQAVELSEKVKALQSICPHHNVTKVHKSNSGNWDRQDSYWTEFKCPDCGKFWSEDGSK
jgi:hypothetical protein